ncbi:MAG: YggT family protein [Anaerolineales bacterium]|jgi:YggT family protein|uniref:YggT family protein n=1 Tax=Candidatus Villigracilis saccharophilus TaxID=3140684 RepID=UPI0031347D51|nr:YggT family protein [Anaerolineales bacterium]MBK8420007.1 YggT family protein [Anaerolineales bacterium]
MNFELLILLIGTVSQVFIWVIIASSLLSFFMPPDHPVREALDRIVDPFLAPIRRVVPLAGTLDFSPLILIIVVQVLSGFLINILR